MCRTGDEVYLRKNHVKSGTPNQVQFEDFLVFARRTIKARHQDSTGFLSHDSKLERVFCDILLSKLPANLIGGNFAAAVRRLFYRFFDVNQSGSINLDELEVCFAFT